MAIADLKPEGFEDAHAVYARWTLRPSATAQGMWAGKYALWLEIDSAGKLDELKAQVTKSLADLRAAAGDLPSNTGDDKRAGIDVMRMIEADPDDYASKAIMFAPAFVERLLADNKRLRETARRLVDVMERSDLEQFENAQPVSGEEWFDAIREAKGMLA